jgi:hypothetical protein
VPRKIEMPRGKLGPQFARKVIPWIEVFWHSHKRYPTDTELSAQFGFDADALIRLKASKFINECLKNRGITPSQDFFTEKQVAAIALITNFTDNRPVDAKLAGIGVTPEMYNGWMQNREFKRELQSRADDILDNVYPEAQAQLAKQVRNGNFQALKFYYEVTGRASSPEAINVKMTMARLIEAVQKHVKDPAVLAAIASEIQAVGPVADVVSVPIPAISQPKSLTDQYKEFRNGN